MSEARGMTICRSNDNSLLFRVVLFDVGDAKIVAGTAYLRLWHVVPTDGTFQSYNFTTNTFLDDLVENTDAAEAMTYQYVTETGPVVYNTGIWTYRATTLTNFTVGDKYIAEVSHVSQVRPITFEFQYGDHEGDDGRNFLSHGPELSAAVGASTITLAASAPGTLNFFNGCFVKIVDGTGEGQTRVIHHYTAARVCHVDPWTTALDATSRYIILPKSDESFIVNSGMATAGSATTISLAVSAEAVVDDTYVGNMVVITGGLGVGQSRVVTAYDATGGATERRATVASAWATNPDATSTYVVFPLAAGTLAPVAIAAIVDAVWDEDIVAAHGTAATAGLLLRVLGSAISLRTFNNTLNSLLGVADTAVTDTVAGQVWEELAASHNTALTMGAIMNSLGPLVLLPAIADAVWNEDASTHVAASSTGLLLHRLGWNIAARTFNNTLEDLLGVPDTGATDTLPIYTTDSVWDENIVAAHGTAGTSGFLVRVLGGAISTRANNANLNALLGVPDVAANTIAYTVLDEVITAAAHVVPNSAAERLYSIDVLTQAAGAGDLAYILGQVEKVDQAACDSPAVADSLADKMDDSLALLALLDRQIICTFNIETNGLRVETGVEQYGIIMTAPWVQCTAQIIDEANAIVKTITPADFGAIGARGFFTYTWDPMTLAAGQTYQVLVTITDGGAGSITSTKIFKLITV